MYPLHCRFELRHGDSDIMALLDNTVPPVDLTKVSIFAQELAKYSAEAGPVYVIYSWFLMYHQQPVLMCLPIGGEKQPFQSSGVLRLRYADFLKIGHDHV